MLKIFDHIERTDSGPADYSERHFSYYNRSARVGVVAIRDVIEKWFARYPAEHQLELRARFRSGNDRDFDSAFFELFIHELLLRLNCKVTVHPDRPTTTGKVPDFLVVADDGAEFFVEAIVASAISDEEVSRQAVVNLVFDQINKINSRDFFICLPELNGASGKQPSGKRIRNFLESKLAGLEADRIAEGWSDGSPLPSWTYTDGGYTMRFELLPKSAEGRLREGVRSLGMLPFEAKWGSDAGTVKNAVQKKGGRYGELGIPYVVAVNALSKWGVDHEDVLEALLGTEAIQYNVATGETIPIRNRDGAFISLTGPIYTRVSAVLVAFAVYPSNVAEVELRLYHNPWAAHGFSGSLCQLPETMVVDGKLAAEEGVSVSTLFELPVGWPGR